MTLFRSRALPKTALPKIMAIALLAGSLSLAGSHPDAMADPAGPAIPPTPATASTVPLSRTAKATTVKKRVVRRAVAKPKSKPNARTTSASARNVKSTSSESGSPSTNTGPAATGKNSGGFGQGSSGSKVLALQQRLEALNYDVTDPDGKFGAQTHHALMAFQKVNGLARTGRANAATLASLDHPIDPTPRVPSGGADRVEIDLPGQYLTLYKGGQILRTVAISSGSGKDFCVVDPDTQKSECDVANTPGGSFRVQSRIIGWRESKLGLLYNPLYFNGGIAIHGAPSVPGYPASHGCVRIPMVSAEWFHDEVFDGMPVYVFGGKDVPPPLGAKAPSDAKGKAATSSGTSVPSTTAPVSTLPGASLITTTIPGSTTAATLAPTTTPAGTGTTLPGSTTTLPGSTTSAAGATTTTASATTTTAAGATSPTAATTSTTTTSTTTTTTTTGLIRLLPATSVPAGT